MSKTRNLQRAKARHRRILPQKKIGVFEIAISISTLLIGIGSLATAFVQIRQQNEHQLRNELLENPNFQIQSELWPGVIDISSGWLPENESITVWGDTRHARNFSIQHISVLEIRLRGSGENDEYAFPISDYFYFCTISAYPEEQNKIFHCQGQSNANFSRNLHVESRLSEETQYDYFQVSHYFRIDYENLAGAKFRQYILSDPFRVIVTDDAPIVFSKMNDKILNDETVSINYSLVDIKNLVEKTKERALGEIN